MELMVAWNWANDDTQLSGSVFRDRGAVLFWPDFGFYCHCGVCGTGNILMASEQKAKE